MIAPLVAYGWALAGQPERTAEASVRPTWPTSSGLTYERRVVDDQRPQIIHIVSIDLTLVDAVTTEQMAEWDPTVDAGNPPETLAETTLAFAERTATDVAINANFFGPFNEVTPWDYEPRSGDQVGLIGLAKAGGRRVSDPWPGRPALCLSPGRGEVGATGTCDEIATTAVAGKTLLVANGRLTDEAATATRPYPQTAVAVDPTGRWLWLIVADGKQPLYSEGSTLAEIAQLAVGLGAESAFQLDGGGSATLAGRVEGGVTVLNAPIHAKWPGLQRPVANNLGFRSRAE